MRSRSAVLTAVMTTVAGAGSLSTASAAASEIQVDRPCYADPSARADTVRLSGRGFTPNASFEVRLDGARLAGGGGRADGRGDVAGSFAAPVVRGAGRRTFRLAVREGDHAAQTTFTVSHLSASFAPSTGPLRTLAVRFSIFGFGLAGEAHPPVYVHYVHHALGLARTVRLGVGGGACGSLRTQRRRLFAFKARRGPWRLQFDTRRRYTRGTAGSPFLYATIGVTVL